MAYAGPYCTSHAYQIEASGTNPQATSLDHGPVPGAGAGAGAVGLFTGAAIKPSLTPEETELLEYRRALTNPILQTKFVHGAYTSPFQTLEACGGAVLTAEEQEKIDALCEIKRQELAIKYSTATDAPAPPGL